MVAVTIAVAVNDQVLGMAVGASEAFWTEFLRSLARGVKLVV